MITRFIKTVLISFLLISFLSCGKQQSENEQVQTVELPDEGIKIQSAWARPGRQNGVSAIYMNILNGSAETDSLMSLSSPVAGMVEVHETYEGEEGMSGMRKSDNIVFPPRSVVNYEPGGVHIMLMQLNEELKEGDEVELILNFTLAGEMSIKAPVQTMQ